MCIAVQTEKEAIDADAMDRQWEEEMGWPFLKMNWGHTKIVCEFGCGCGKRHYLDGCFGWNIKCGNCGRKYHLSSSVRLMEITGDVDFTRLILTQDHEGI